MLHIVAKATRSACRLAARWADRVRFVAPERPEPGQDAAPANVSGNLLGNVIGGVR